MTHFEVQWRFPDGVEAVRTWGSNPGGQYKTLMEAKQWLAVHIADFKSRAKRAGKDPVLPEFRIVKFEDGLATVQGKIHTKEPEDKKRPTAWEKILKD
jgi:hypothetical protein